MISAPACRALSRHFWSISSVSNNPSWRAKRSNPAWYCEESVDCFVASLLAMTNNCGGSESHEQKTTTVAERRARAVRRPIPRRWLAQIPSRFAQDQREGRARQGAGAGDHRGQSQAPQRFPGEALRAGPLVALADLPGHGCGGKGFRDQGRVRGRQPAGLRGHLVQAALHQGARPRLHVARHDGAGRARPYRHLQPLLLRGVPGRTRASRRARQAEAPVEARDQEYLARTLRGYFGDRALPRASGHGDPEILPQRLEGRAARALPRPARRAREELEILDGRHPRARAVAALPGGLSGHDPPHCEGGGAVVRGAGRSQMVRAGGDRLGHRQHARLVELALSPRRQGLPRRVRQGARGARERGREKIPQVRREARESVSRSFRRCARLLTIVSVAAATHVALFRRWNPRALPIWGMTAPPPIPSLTAWSVIASVEAGQLEVVGWGRRRLL